MTRRSARLVRNPRPRPKCWNTPGRAHARSRGGDLLLTQTGPSQQKAPLRQLIANNKLLNYPAGLDPMPAAP